MSASKQNIQRGVFLSKQRRSLKNLYQSSNFYKTMQNGFGETKLMRKASEGSSMQTSMINFHKTIAVGEGSGGWARPQSKHANRNTTNRPQTSKGSRKQPCQNDMMIFSSILKKQKQQNITTLHKTTTTGKKTFKRGSNINSIKQSNQQEHNKELGSKLMMFNNWERYEPWRQKNDNVENDDDKEDGDFHEQDIEIVVNRRVLGQQCRQQQSTYKKGASLHRNKFQTDLDDEFLELFAD